MYWLVLVKYNTVGVCFWHVTQKDEDENITITLHW